MDFKISDNTTVTLAWTYSQIFKILRSITAGIDTDQKVTQLNSAQPKADANSGIGMILQGFKVHDDDVLVKIVKALAPKSTSYDAVIDAVGVAEGSLAQDKTNPTSDEIDKFWDQLTKEAKDSGFFVQKVKSLETNLNLVKTNGLLDEKGIKGLDVLASEITDFLS